MAIARAADEVKEHAPRKDEDSDSEPMSWLRPYATIYRIAGWTVVAILVASFGLLALGATAPGWFTLGSWTLIVGASLIALYLALPTVSIVLARMAERLRAEGRAIEKLEDQWEAASQALDQNAARLDQGIKEQRHALRDAKNSLDHAIKDGLKAMERDMQNALGSSSQENQKAIRDAAADLEQKIMDLDGATSTVQDALKRDVRSLTKAMEDQVAGLKAVDDTMAQIQRSAQKAQAGQKEQAQEVKILVDARRRTDKETRALRKDVDDLKRLSDQQRKRIEGEADKLGWKLDDLARRHDNAIAQVQADALAARIEGRNARLMATDALAELLSRAKEVQATEDAVHTRLADHARHVKDDVREVDESLHGPRKTRRRAIRQLETRLDKVADMLDDVPKSALAKSPSATATKANVDSALSSKGKPLTWAETLADSIAKLRDDIAELGDSVSEEEAARKQGDKSLGRDQRAMAKDHATMEQRQEAAKAAQKEMQKALKHATADLDRLNSAIHAETGRAEGAEHDLQQAIIATQEAIKAAEKAANEHFNMVLSEHGDKAAKTANELSKKVSQARNALARSQREAAKRFDSAVSAEAKRAAKEASELRAVLDDAKQALHNAQLDQAKRFKNGLQALQEESRDAIARAIDAVRKKAKAGDDQLRREIEKVANTAHQDLVDAAMDLGTRLSADTTEIREAFKVADDETRKALDDFMKSMANAPATDAQREEMAEIAITYIEKRLRDLLDRQEAALLAYTDGLDTEYGAFLNSPPKVDKHKVHESTAPRMYDASPFGHVRPVRDIVADATAREELRAADINDTQDLWAATPRQIAYAARCTTGQARRWQRAAALSAIEHIGPSTATLLAEAGVESVHHLAQRDAPDLYKRIQKVMENGHAPRDGKVGLGHVEAWIQAAREHRPANRVKSMTKAQQS